ncbi:MAG TPA: glycoside hydrolase family 3 C-terminal domain-containing protein [Pinirhizobacter sp.]|jgi:beta-glucosidase
MNAGVHASALVSRMTLPEKISQLQSAAPAIARLGVPAYDWWNEGLHGLARSGPATVFPQAIGLAASWNPSLMQEVGGVVARQARERYAAIGPGNDHPRYHGLTIWSPNINIFRDPRWGRGQETYGEDPTLTAALARGFIGGLQGSDRLHPTVIATPKHFAVHSGPETGRHGFNVNVSPHDLEDTYLPAFRAAIVDAHAGSIMCAYNAIGGTPVCALPWLLGERLRGDWGFRGYVVSDCDAIDDMTHFHHYRPDNAGSAASALRAGTDLDCGDAYAALGEAVAEGKVDVNAIDTAVIRLFTARFRLGMFDPPVLPRQTGTTERVTDRQLALRAALQSIVLLKNEHGVLPLKANSRIAVIGPHADVLDVLEANYHGTAYAPVTPLAGLVAQFGKDNVRYAQGSTLAPGVAVVVPSTALRDTAGNGTPGLRGEYFATRDFTAKPVMVRSDARIDLDVDHAPPAKGLPADGYAVRWSGELHPPGPGDYTLRVMVDRCYDCLLHDKVRLYIDDRLLTQIQGDDDAATTTLHVADARARRLRVEWQHGQDQGIHLQWIAPADAQRAEARRVMDGVDAVVAFVGLSPGLEGEELKVDVPGFAGGDRTDLELPAPQQRLLETAAASGKPLVVVLMSGSAVALNWAKAHADAIVVAWYPGEEGGTAIARTLSGSANPAGRLPVTFYHDVGDLPAFTNYAMKGRTYRYFAGEPLFAFGDGLSYTRFSYDTPTLSTTSVRAGQQLEVSVTVHNTGQREGEEVVQAYLSYPDAHDAPRRALVGFQRVAMAAGKSRIVHLSITPRALSLVDANGKRRVRPGHYKLYVGGSQPGPGQRAIDFTITGQARLPL